jgi:hypothetical protein
LELISAQPLEPEQTFHFEAMQSVGNAGTPDLSAVEFFVFLEEKFKASRTDAYAQSLQYHFIDPGPLPL